MRYWFGAQLLEISDIHYLQDLILQQLERTRKMTIDISKLTAEVTQIETVAASVQKVVTEIAAELRALRSEGGGALQTQLDALASRLEASAGTIGQAVQDGTAAEGETPAPPTSEQVLAEQGAAQAAADHLDDQAANAPK